MTDQIGAIIDTSVFVAGEQGRPMRRITLPRVTAISVVTVAELRLAVLNTGEPTQRALCLATLERALRLSPVPIDEVIALQWAFLRSAARGQGQHRINDLWIAATALALRVPVVTQDEGFLALEKVGGPAVILV